MNINMTDYKMIVDDEVYNVLQVHLWMKDDGKEQRIDFVEATYLDANGMIQAICGEASRFQFIRRI